MLTTAAVYITGCCQLLGSMYLDFVCSGPSIMHRCRAFPFALARLFVVDLMLWCQNLRITKPKKNLGFVKPVFRHDGHCWLCCCRLIVLNLCPSTLTHSGRLHPLMHTNSRHLHQCKSYSRWIFTYSLLHKSHIMFPFVFNQSLLFGLLSVWSGSERWTLDQYWGRTGDAFSSNTTLRTCALAWIVFPWLI